MLLDRAWIERHVPHRGRMCLLDEVLAWDAQRLSCRSASHRAAAHPLFAHGRLGVACGVEYAAQTMAVHGALLGGAADGTTPSPSATPSAGVLAGVRNMTTHVLRLDDVAGDLMCEASRIAGDALTALYEFEVRSEARCLLHGRATVLLDAAGRFHP